MQSKWFVLGFALTSVAFSACAEQEVDSDFDEGYAEGFDDGYEQGLADVQSGTGGAGGFSDKELRAHMDGFWDGMLVQSYSCSSDTDCVTGEFCTTGFCLPPLPCDEPHPNSDRGRCSDDCSHRYQATLRSKLCVESCICFEYTGDRVCRSEDNCKLPWTDCVAGRCEDNNLTPREMFPIP